MSFHQQISNFTRVALLIGAEAAPAETFEQITAEALRRNLELQVFEQSIAAIST